MGLLTSLPPQVLLTAVTAWLGVLGSFPGSQAHSAPPLAILRISESHYSCLQIDQMFAAFPPDVTGNLDYKNLVHIITHGEEKD